MQQKIGDFQSTYDEARQKILDLKSKAENTSDITAMGVGNNVADYLNGKVTEDAIFAEYKYREHKYAFKQQPHSRSTKPVWGKNRPQIW